MQLVKDGNENLVIFGVIYIYVNPEASHNEI